MSKVKPTEKQVIITEQQKQNDPYIKYVSKKTRNLTKKITDIEGLQKKLDLKPEQIEKIKNKSNIIQERRKYEDFIKIYKQITEEISSQKKQVQNDVEPKEQQNQTKIFLNSLAHILALGQSDATPEIINNIFNNLHIPRFPGDNLRPINSLLIGNGIDRFPQPPFLEFIYFNEQKNQNRNDNHTHPDQTFKDLTNNIYATLVGLFLIRSQLADALKCQEFPTKIQNLLWRRHRYQDSVFHNKRQTDATQVVVNIQKQVSPLINIQNQKPEVKAQKITVQVVQNNVKQTEEIHTQNTTTIVPVTPVMNTAVITQVVEQNKKEQNNLQQETSKPVQSPTQQNQQSVVQKPIESEPTKTQNEQRREKRNYKNYNKNYQPRNDYKNNDKREYKPRKFDNTRKPKYNERKDDDTSLSSSEERQYKRREFKATEIKQLNEEGFTVVGNPKPKDDYHRKQQQGYKNQERRYQN